MASAWYNKGKFSILKGDVNLNSDTIKVMFLKSTYAFDASAHKFVSDIVASECDFTNYARKTLAGKSFTEAVTSFFTANNPTWTTAGGATNNTIGWAVVFKDTGADGTSVLLFCLDPADITTNSGDITLQWAAGGIASLT